MGFVVKVADFSLEYFWFSTASHFITIPGVALQMCDRHNQSACYPSLTLQVKVPDLIWYLMGLVVQKTRF
jgi:hypothetical protein